MRTVALPVALREQVVGHILQTRHNAKPSQGDAAFVIDIDLGILGQNESVHSTFEANVHKEYRWVPWPDFSARRTSVLQSFVDRSKIYSTDWFYEHLEPRARTNLRRQTELLNRPLEITDTTRF